MAADMAADAAGEREGDEAAPVDEDENEDGRPTTAATDLSEADSDLPEVYEMTEEEKEEERQDAAARPIQARPIHHPPTCSAHRLPVPRLCHPPPTITTT